MISRGFFGGSDESTVDVRAVDLTAASEQAQSVCMAEVLGYGSDVMLSIASMKISGTIVEAVDYDCLLSFKLESMRGEDHYDEEVLLGGGLDALLEVGAGGIDDFFV